MTVSHQQILELMERADSLPRGPAQVAVLDEAVRLADVRGDIEWLGTRLPPGVGPTLGHVLLEHARRFDELPKVLESLGDLDRLAIPLAEPGMRPNRPTASPSSNDWDFFSDPDPAAMNEWNDAVAVFALCDGESSLREIVDAAMLGEFFAERRADS